MGEIVKKIGGVLAGVLMAVILLAGCQNGNEEQPEVFDRETVESEAVRSIGYFNERDYQSILDMGSEELKEAITPEQFAQQCDPILEAKGGFQEIVKTVYKEQEEEKSGLVYGGVMIVGAYEKGKIQFAIAFDEEMKLIQFLVK